MIHGILPAALCGGQDAPKHRNCRRLRRQQCVGLAALPLCGRPKEPHHYPMRPMPQPAAEGRDGLPVPRFAERQSGDRRRRPSTAPTKPTRRHHRKMVAPQHRADETGSPAPLGNGVPRCRYRSQRYGIPPQLGAAPDAEAGSGIAARCWMPRVMGWRAGYFFRTGGKITS